MSFPTTFITKSREVTVVATELMWNHRWHAYVGLALIIHGKLQPVSTEHFDIHLVFYPDRKYYIHRVSLAYKVGRETTLQTQVIQGQLNSHIHTDYTGMNMDAKFYNYTLNSLKDMQGKVPVEFLTHTWVKNKTNKL